MFPTQHNHQIAVISVELEYQLNCDKAHTIRLDWIGQSLLIPSYCSVDKVPRGPHVGAGIGCDLSG